MASREDKKVIQKGIEDTTAYYQNKYQESKRKKKPEDPARPSLIKRFAGILLDSLIIAATAFGLQTIMYNTIYKPLGYFNDRNIVAKLNSDSHLFVEGETGGLVQITKRYDTSKTPEENYDVPLTYYYSTNERAIEKGLLERYNTAKADSYLFEFNGESYVRSSFATDKSIRTFLENHYKSAIEFHKANPEYIKHVNHSMLVTIGTLMLNATFTSAVYFLLIPMLDKKHRSLGMMAIRTILVTTDKKPSTKMQVALRYAALLLMNFLAPIGIYLLYPEMVGIMWFINAGIICFTPTFDSLHGVFSKTKTINESFSNPMESYKQIKDMIEIEKQNNPDAFKKPTE